MGITLKPEPGPRLTVIFEVRFMPESQIYRVVQGMPDWRVLLA